jgi:hypothetical protein
MGGSERGGCKNATGARKQNGEKIAHRETVNSPSMRKVESFSDTSSPAVIAW